MLSAGGVPPVANPIGGPPSDGAIDPIAALEQRAATLLQRTVQAAAVARDAAADAADINSAHATIVAQHRKMFCSACFWHQSRCHAHHRFIPFTGKIEDVQVRQVRQTLQLHNRSPHQLG